MDWDLELLTGRTALAHDDLITAPARLLDLDFSESPPGLDGHSFVVPVEVERDGTIQATVIYFRAHLDETTQLTNCPLAPISHWAWRVQTLPNRVEVRAGDTVELEGSVSGARLDVVDCRRRS